VVNSDPPNRNPASPPRTEFRAYQPGDSAAVKTLINQAFHIDQYVNAAHLTDGALAVYLHSVLANSTWAQVAMLGGEVVGFLFGRVVGQHPLPGRWQHRLAASVHGAKLLVTGARNFRDLWQFVRVTHVNEELRSQSKAPTKDEITLFAVDANTHGLGIGKTLYNNYLTQLRKHGRSDYYLYTDAMCNVGFYESRGMNRAAAKEMTVFLDGKPVPLEIYVYTGNATE
jgi:GNAT superfamily N-acetyltransferase